MRELAAATAAAGVKRETAYIARGDWLSQAIGKLACELFWFHPLVWRAFARLRAEAERATDDCVLRSGMPACEYATHLVELARRPTNARPERLAIGIVSTNDLERRLVATLLAADTVRLGNATSKDQMRVIIGADGRSRGAASGSTAKDKFSIRPTSKSVSPRD